MSLKYEDLKNTILPFVSIDEFEPKAGDTEKIIVLAFYTTDQGPADDLNTFIQRGTVNTADVDISPNTDDDGRYLVFVEMNRDSKFPESFRALIKDIENVTGKMDWKVRTYLSNDREFEINDPAIFDYIIVNPNEYVSKDEFMKESIEGNVKSFLQEAHIMYWKFEGNTMTIGAGGKAIVAEVVDIGEYDTVIGRNFLAESAFRLTNRPLEAKVLASLLGVYDVMPIDEFLCVNKDDKVMLLKNTEIKYRG